MASKNENLHLGTKMFNEIIRKGKFNGDKGYLGESYAMFGLVYLVVANVGASNLVGVFEVGWMEFQCSKSVDYQRWLDLICEATFIPLSLAFFDSIYGPTSPDHEDNILGSKNSLIVVGDKAFGQTPKQEIGWGIFM